MKKLLKDITEYPIVFIFFAICAGFLAGYIAAGDNDYSQMENRYLQKRPHLSADGLFSGTFMESFETYTNEQVPFRTLLVRCKAALVQMSGSSENDGIAKGEDAYLFDKTLATSDKLSGNIGAISTFVSEANRDIYIAVAPTSTWLNEDKLPAGMPVLDEHTCTEELTDALGQLENAHITDLYEALLPHKDEQLYYRCDHHWTTAAAGYAYGAIITSMGYEPGDITKYTKHVADDFRGTHFAKYKGLFTVADCMEYYDVPVDELVLPDGVKYDLVDTDKLSGFDKYGAFMYGNFGKCRIKADKGSGRNLIIFKDSYANCLIPYLVMNYDNITVIDLRYFGEGVGDVLAEDAEADVLLMYNWSFINEDNHFYKLVSR